MTKYKISYTICTDMAKYVYLLGLPCSGLSLDWVWFLLFNGLPCQHCLFRGCMRLDILRNVVPGTIEYKTELLLVFLVEIDQVQLATQKNPC